MTDVIYERAAVRESSIWQPFECNGPFDSAHENERAILFGLYANTYLHGQNYLREIEAEDLARLVDTFNNNMARLSNEESQTVLEIAAKRYVEAVKDQIHEGEMSTRRQKIDALEDEYDAREAALSADREALVTKRAEVQLAWDRAAQKIKELEMKTELEAVNYSLVEVDIAEQELKAARADLAVIEAGLKGLDIQLAIAQAGIDITNTELQITESENEVKEIGIRIKETEVAESGVDLDIRNAGIALSKSMAEGERIKVDTKGVAVTVADTEQQTVETNAREHRIGAEIARIGADTAKLKLVDSDLAIAQSEVRVAHAENNLLTREQRMIKSRENNVKKETVFTEKQKTVQEALDGKILDQDQSDHDFAVESGRAERRFEDELKEIKVNALDTRRTLADNIKDRKVQDAEARSEIPDIRADAAEEYADAAIKAAEEMAQANIVNTLTHSIG